MSHDLPPNLRQEQHLQVGDVTVDGQGHYLDFSQKQIIQISVDEIKTREFISTSPYKGLKPFEAEDKDRFFGRDQFLQELSDSLEQTNLILLLGASGSGKSSVIRAGLIPQLSKRYGARFVHLIFKPDHDPFESLYAKLLDKYKQSEAQIVRAGQADTLTQVITKLKPSDAFWFFVIDQFEELFTTSQPEQRDRFIAGLVNLANHLKKVKDLSVKIIATMRADFLDRLSPYPDLVKATDRYRPFMAEMQPDELRLAIEQPAAQHGVVFETGLVEEIIKDVQGQAGYLPLLQYTLNLLWEKEVETGSISDRTLNTSTYRTLGGVRGALQTHVEQIYKSLSDEEQLAAQRIFLKLVEIGGEAEAETEWKPVRRRALRSEFNDVLEQQVLRQLIDANLLVSDQKAEAQVSTIEIAHEVLLTSWITLNNWIKGNRQAIALRNRLNDDVARWQTTKKEDELWSGSKLARALELRQKSTFNQVLGGFSPAASQFIDSSVGRRDRQRRRTIIGLSSFSALALVLAGFAVWQSLISVSRELAAKASLQLTIDPEKSLQFAKQAMDKYYTPEAEDALRKSLFESRVRAKIQIPNYQHTNPIWTVAFSSDSKHVVATNMKDGTVKILDIDTLDDHTSPANGKAFTNGDFVLIVSDDGKAEIRNVKTGEVRVLSESLKGITNAAFSPDGKFVFISRSEKSGQIVNVTTGVVTVLSESSLSNVAKAVFSPDNKFLVTISDDWKAQLWNVSTGSFIRELPGHTSKFGRLEEVTVVQFSPDGNYIATACGFGAGCYLGSVRSDGIYDFDGTVQIWRRTADTFDLFHELPTGNDRVYGLAFDPKSQLVATASGDKVARVWDVSTGKQMSAFTGHPNWVWSAAFSPDSNLVVTAGSTGGTARVWEARTGKELLVLRGHQNFVVSAVFSPDGRFVLTTGNDGTARIWELNIGQPSQQSDLGVFETIPDPDPSVQQKLRQRSTENWNRAVSSRDRKLVVTFNDQEQSYATAQVWEADTGHLILSLDKYKDGPLAATFSPDNKFIALAEYGNTAKVWEISTGQTVTLVGHESSIHHLAFSPNSACVATASDDGMVRLWRTTTGDSLEIFQQIKGKVSMIAFEPDGNSVLVRDGNNSMLVYSSAGCAPTEDIRTLAKSYIEQIDRKR